MRAVVVPNLSCMDHNQEARAEAATMDYYSLGKVQEEDKTEEERQRRKQGAKLDCDGSRVRDHSVRKDWL